MIGFVCATGAAVIIWTAVGLIVRELQAGDPR